MKYLTLIAAFLFISTISANAQKYGSKEASLLASKKWTVVEVKSKEPDFEVGEEIAFDIDKKFRIKKNNMDRVTGTWFLDKDYLLLTVEGASGMGTGRRVPKKMKVLKMNKDELKVKYKIEKHKEKLTLR